MKITEIWKSSILCLALVGAQAVFACPDGGTRWKVHNKTGGLLVVFDHETDSSTYHNVMDKEWSPVLCGEYISVEGTRGDVTVEPWDWSKDWLPCTGNSVAYHITIHGCDLTQTDYCTYKYDQLCNWDPVN